MLRRLALMLIILFEVLPAGAQDITPVLPPCAEAEVLMVVRDIDEFADDFREVANELGGSEDLGEVAGQIEQVERLQRRWWSELVPLFPVCRGLDQFATAYGRMLDELLIYLSLQYVALSEIEAGRVEVGASLGLVLSSHLDSWVEIHEQAEVVADQLDS